MLPSQFGEPWAAGPDDPTPKEDSDKPVEVIRIIFTSEDVYDLADEHGVDRDKALAAALDWSKHIVDTMTGYCFEQLESVILTGEP